MLEQVAKTIRRYSMFRGGERVAVAVSGGADSLCLLYVLLELAPRWGLSLSVLHFDHQLRGEESRRDAEFVAELAERLGLRARVESADVRALARESHDNLEQAARLARRNFFLGVLQRGEADLVALGHTRSDQAETVLFRLLRGAGLTGLAGIRAVTPEGFVRPLIETSREEIEEYLRRRGIGWRLDSTNLDLSLARNRIRRELLPRLRREFNPSLEQVLAQTATLAQDEEQYWDQEIGRLAGRLLTEGNGAVSVSASALAGLPRAVARRLIRRAIQSVRGDLRGVDFHHVESVMELAGRPEGGGMVCGPGFQVRRSFDRLRFRLPQPSAEPPDYQIALQIPGRCRPPGADFQLCFEIRECPVADSRYNTRRSALDWGRIAGPCQLRNWRPGDKYRPAGHAGEVKLKQLFQKAQIPLWERRKWPIMTIGREILWARRFGPAAQYAAGPASPVVLEISEISES